MLLNEYRPVAARAPSVIRNGESPETLSSGPPPPEARCAGADDSFCPATIDWADRRPRLDSDAGSTNRARSSPRRLVSRAMTGVMSRSVRWPTSAKVREISSAGRACDGDRVVNGPVTTTPRASPASSMARSPGRTTRDRCALAKSSVATTFQPRRSTSATRTRPVKSAAARRSVVARAPPASSGVTRRPPPAPSAAARARGSGVARRPESPGASPSRGATTALLGGRG
jgi:hypothetical protein